MIVVEVISRVQLVGHLITHSANRMFCYILISYGIST